MKERVHIAAKRFVMVYILCLFAMVYIAQPIVFAATDAGTENRRSITQGRPYYNPNDTLCATSDASNILDPGAATEDLPNGLVTTNKDLTNEARVWQFLTNADGLNLDAYAAAGFMGNIRQEAGGAFDPNAIENGVGAGYGIIQWTGGRRTKVENYISAMRGTYPDADLMDIQLSYLRKELTTNYKGTYAMLKNSNSVEVVFKRGEGAGTSKTFSEPLQAKTIIVHGSSGVGKFIVNGSGTNFIASGDDFSNIVPGNRYTNAKDYYEKYTGEPVSTATGSVNSDCSTTPAESGTGTAGVYGWDLEGPNKMHYYIQAGQSWSSAPFGSCGNIGTCGCPIVTVASIISTLTSSKENPAQLRKKYGQVFYSNIPTYDEYGLKKTLIKSANGTADWGRAVDTLRNGGLIMAHANKGTFTSNQHWFVIRKVSEDGNSFYIYDLRNPKSENNNKAFSTQELLGAGNIDVLYGFTK